MQDETPKVGSESFAGFLRRRFRLDTRSGRNTALALLLVCIVFDILFPATLVLDFAILALLRSDYSRERRSVRGSGR